MTHLVVFWELSGYSERFIAMNRPLFLLGFILLGLALLGFLFVADDLRHTGELVTFGAVSFGGILLLALSYFTKHRRIRLNKFVWIGGAITLFGIAAFGTVADDLEHANEIILCSSIVLTGLLTLLFSLRGHRSVNFQ